MAAITFATTASNRTTLDGWNPAVRTASAQATTGQTDWFWVPAWAQIVTVYFNVTAVAGTTPITSLDILLAHPTTLDDGDTVPVIPVATTADVTAASLHVYEFGPMLVTPTQTDSATADSIIVQNAVVPQVLGLQVTNDRTTANETYTYTISVRCQG